MIGFKKDEEPNKRSETLQKLLDILYDDTEYYNGSFYESSDLTELVQIVYKVLFEKKNNSIQLTIDKNPNNSIDITIDTIK